ncbi:MAG: YIP1 family protein [Nitrososphaerales archaeon]
MESRNISILQKCKQVLIHPSELFESVKYERGIGPAFQYLALFSMVIAAGSITYLLFFPEDIPLSEFPEFLPFLDDLTAIGIIIAIPVYILALLSYFVLAGWMHIFAKLFRGKGDYSATYKANVYASTPSLLFGWVPIAGIAVELYSLYLTILGLSKLHEVSMARAFGMIITSIIIIFVPVIAVIVALISSGLVPDIGELLPELDKTQKV